MINFDLSRLKERISRKIFYYTRQDSSDIPPCQSVAQGRFMVGAAHKSKLMRDR